MQFKGIVKEVSPVTSGISKTGREWMKLEAVIETEEHYPQSICVTQLGDVIDQQRLIVGERVIASLSFRTNNYNGRWYNSITCWKVEPVLDNE